MRIDPRYCGDPRYPALLKKLQDQLFLELEMPKLEGWLHGEKCSDERIRSILWHKTRQIEYPWALLECPPRGAVIDFGSNPQFPMAALGLSLEVVHWTIHHIPEDIPLVGMVWNRGLGNHSMKPFMEKYAERVSLVVGKKLSFLRGTADVVYCISVLEHVPPQELGDVIGEMQSWLKSGGALCVTCDWWGDYPFDYVKEDIRNQNLKDFFPGIEEKYAVDVPWLGADMSGSGLPNGFGVYGFVWRKP